MPCSLAQRFLTETFFVLCLLSLLDCALFVVSTLFHPTLLCALIAHRAFRSPLQPSVEVVQGEGEGEV